MNLCHLIVWQCNVNYAHVLLPKVSKTLLRLSLLYIYNAEGPYLLCTAVPEGVLLALRSLSIPLNSGNGPTPREGHRWLEDENGCVSQADARKPCREFDGNYIIRLLPVINPSRSSIYCTNPLPFACPTTSSTLILRRSSLKHPAEMYAIQYGDTIMRE